METNQTEGVPPAPTTTDRDVAATHLSRATQRLDGLLEERRASLYSTAEERQILDLKIRNAESELEAARAAFVAAGGTLS